MKNGLFSARQFAKQVFRFKCFLFLIFFSVFSNAVFADIEEAENAIEQGDYPEAFRLLSSETEPSARVNYYLGLLTYLGLGVEQDTQRGLELLEMSGSAGFKPAMIKLVEIYRESYQAGNPSEIQIAIWVSNLANTEDPYWQRELGALYRLGIGVQQDETASFLMLVQSALNGYGPAMLDLYHAYNHGIGTEMDKTQALKWLRGASSKGVEGAQELVEYERDIINYQTLVSKSPFVPKVIINYSLACNHCVDFFYSDLTYYLDQAEQSRLSIILREMPFRLQTNRPDEFGDPLPDVVTPSYYIHCIRSLKGTEVAAEALVALSTIARDNISPTQDGSHVFDWRYLGHPTDGSAIKNFQSKQVMYESLLSAYSVDVSECSQLHYADYVENIANVNVGISANTFEFNDQSYSPGILELPSMLESERLRVDVEHYLSNI
ncbi:MAG: tetratricopeptide repeat protein [Saccharospirillum sp.]|uniref:tetratricopeptide repeat protein n=1 Tax=Saccharospirillum sp. TaxID=2033801 RepID=UPI003298A185